MRAVGPYRDELRAIVHALKYQGRISVAQGLGELMRTSGHDVLAGADAVVPVPLHARRRRQRGFNQAALLASHLRLPMQPVLRRVVYTRPQVELPAARRHRNVRTAFAAAPSHGPVWRDWRAWFAAPSSDAIRGRVLVLIDDVITTGATLDACARVLKAAGAREVRALTAARVVSEPMPAPDR